MKFYCKFSHLNKVLVKILGCSEQNQQSSIVDRIAATDSKQTNFYLQTAQLSKHLITQKNSRHGYRG